MVFLQFLNLPRLPRELVFHHLSPVDLFIFSLTSKRSWDLVKRAKVHSDLMEFKFDGGKTRIRMKRGKVPTDILITFSTTSLEMENSRQKLEDWNRRVQIKGTPITLRKRFTSYYDLTIVYHLGTKNPVHVICNYLQEMLKIKQVSLTMQSLNPFQFLSNIKCPLKDLQFTDAKWLTKDHLLDFDCERLEIHGSNVTSEDLKDFFCKWKSGGFPRLKEMKLLTSNTLWRIVGPVDDEGNMVFKDNKGNVGSLSIRYGLQLSFVVDSSD